MIPFVSSDDVEFMTTLEMVSSYLCLPGMRDGEE
jgi:hypothetical protein